MTRPKILLADDHRIVLEGLKKLLEPEFNVTGMVENGLELLETTATLRPDVIVADISMPKLNGLESVRQIHKVYGEVKIIFLTMHADVAYAMSALEAGASGYVLKNSAPDELVTAIREALQGRTYITPRIAGDLIRACKNEKLRLHAATVSLTPRQRDILQLLVKGYNAKDIATSLDISAKNVEYHKYRMMELLDIPTSAELITYAVQNGLLTP